MLSSADEIVGEDIKKSRILLRDYGASGWAWIQEEFVGHATKCQGTVP